MKISMVLLLCLFCIGCVEEKSFYYGENVKVIDGFYGGQLGIIISNSYDFELRKAYRILLENGEISDYIVSYNLSRRNK
jgi:hypothetical protein